MEYIQISIPVNDPALQEILIARLDEYGYEGFEEQANELQAFIPRKAFDSARLEEVLSGWTLTYTYAILEEKNWNEEWEKDFHPVVVDDFCAIRASFHPPTAGVTHELVITPKMSFGTGHHATTWMMIQAMAQIDLKDRRVLDFGTGTGVLAILAARLGARDVLAVDNDEWSIANAIENTDVNHTENITIRKMNKVPSGDPFDVILANVNKHVIVKELPAMGQHLAEGGVILLSGLLENDFEDVEKEAIRLTLPISRRLTKEGWICLAILKKDK